MSLDVTIRQAEISDLDELHRVEVAAFPDGGYDMFAIRQLLDICPQFVLLAESNEILAFTIGARIYDSSDAWILNLAVVPEAQRQGIGSELTKELLKRLLDSDAKDIRLTVSPQNVAGQKLYEQFDFSVEKTVDKYFDDSPRMIMKYSK